MNIKKLFKFCVPYYRLSYCKVLPVFIGAVKTAGEFEEEQNLTGKFNQCLFWFKFEEIQRMSK